MILILKNLVSAMNFKYLWLLLVAAVITVLVGCGGGGNSSSIATNGGNIQVGVTWPEASRLIPIAANSIKIDVYDGATLITSQVIAKPATMATFSGVPTGNLTVVATAYPNSNGTGVAQATGTAGALVTAGNTTVVGLTMGSTITHIDMTPTSLNLTGGQTSTLVATPKDASNNVVLVSPLNINYVSSNPLVATVGLLDGSVLALLAGTTTITATEIESGVSGTANVTVSVGVSLNPTTFTIPILGTKLFVATVTGSVNGLVTWSVVEAGGGSVLAGLYTAPAVGGTYHVKATSVADPTKSATATVTVTSGGLIVNVN